MLIRSRRGMATFLSVVALSAVARAQSPAPHFHVAESWKIGGGGGWDYITLSPDSKTLYVTRSTHTQVINASTGKLTADIPGESKAHGVAIVPSVGRGFITNGGTGIVSIFDLATNKVLGGVKTVPDCDGIFYDAALNKVLVVSGDGNAFFSIAPDVDPKGGKAEEVDLGGAPESFAFDGAGKAYIALNDKNLIAVVDIKTMKVLARWPIGKAEKPVGVGLDREKHVLFVGCRSKSMVVMSADDGHVMAELPIGGGVDATLFDGKYAFASCGDGTLSVVGETSPGKYEVVQKVKTAVGARTMTANDQSETLYLPAAEAEGKPGAKGRPRFAPDSFKIVVVKPKSGESH